MAVAVTGIGGDRLSPASGKGALGVGPRAPRVLGWASAGSVEALGLSLLFSGRPLGLLLQLLLLIQRLAEKWGGSPRDAQAGVLARPGQGVRGSRRRAGTLSCAVTATASRILA